MANNTYFQKLFNGFQEKFPTATANQELLTDYGHSDVAMKLLVDTYCQNCGELIGSPVVLKSRIYNSYNIAFKFVNRHHIFWMGYFNEGWHKLPLGEIEEDIGPIVNDFMYQDYWRDFRGDYLYSRHVDDLHDATDLSTSRAYRISVQIDKSSREQIECVCVTNETGLEVFLIAAGTVLGVEVARYGLKHIVQAIEDKINEWYKGISEESEKPIVDYILVRTSNWEVSLRGEFTDEEKQQLLDYIGQNIVLKPKLTDYLSDMENKHIVNKALHTSREITDRYNVVVENNRRKTILNLIYRNERRLHKLMEKQATQGLSTDPQVLIEIEDIEGKIVQLKEELKSLKQ